MYIVACTGLPARTSPVCVCTYVCARVRVCVCVCVCVCVFVCVCLCVCVCVGIHVCIYGCIHTYIHTRRDAIPEGRGRSEEGFLLRLCRVTTRKNTVGCDRDARIFWRFFCEFSVCFQLFFRFDSRSGECRAERRCCRRGDYMQLILCSGQVQAAALCATPSLNMLLVYY